MQLLIHGSQRPPILHGADVAHAPKRPCKVRRVCGSQSGRDVGDGWPVLAQQLPGCSGAHISHKLPVAESAARTLQARHERRRRRGAAWWNRHQRLRTGDGHDHVLSFGDSSLVPVDHRGMSSSRHYWAGPRRRVARRKLLFLHDAAELNDLRVPPGNRLESLRGKRKGFHSIRINDQWRVVFRWRGGNAFEVEVVDYH